MSFEILDLVEITDIGIECVFCPVMDTCTLPVDTPIRITKDIYNRSNCDGAVFDTWEIVGR